MYYAPPLWFEADRTLPAGYTPPAHGSAGATVSSSGPYAWKPSEHDQADAILPSGYTAPTHGAGDRTLTRPLSGGTQIIDATGFTDLAFGAPSLINFLTYALPSGIASVLAFGTAAIRNAREQLQHRHYNGSRTLLSGYTPPAHGAAGARLKKYGDMSLFGLPSVSGPRTIRPASVNDGQFGTPDLRNFLSIVAPTGMSTLGVGTAWVSHFSRTLLPGGITPGSFGTAAMAGGIRPVYPNGINPGAVGAASITYAVREVFPLWWLDTFFGSAILGFHRSISVPGLDATLFGDTYVRDNRKFVEPPGWIGGGVGQQAIAYAVRTLRAATIEPGDFDHWTPPRIANRSQFIRPEYAPGRWIEGGIGDEQVMSVRNVNRIVDLIGNGIAPVFRGVSPFLTVANKARIIAPAGDALVRWGNNQAAHAIRTVYPQGFESFRYDRFTNVYNAAQQLLPAGISPEPFGLAHVVNTRRWITYAGGIAPGVLGIPFVAPRVRSITPSAPMEPAGGRIGTAWVSHAVRSIAPLPPAFGWGGFFGAPALSIHRNIIAANSIPPINGVASPRIANVTPELRPYWNTADFTRWGRPNVFNQFQTYAMQGFQAALFGLHFIDYRTKRILAGGLDAFRSNNLHRVRNNDPDPPGVQYVVDASAGSGVIPFPAVTGNSLFPTSIFEPRFGQADVRTNVIAPKGMPPIFDEDAGSQVGIPHVLGPQTIAPNTIGLTERFGKPQFSPLTIWAPFGAPEQARINHPPGDEEVIDAYLDRANLYRPIFGSPQVDLKNRRVLASGAIPGAFGFPALGERPIYVRPDGIKAAKYGFPVINGGGLVEVYNVGSTDVFGQPAVVAVEPFIRHLAPSGAEQLTFGTTWVANFIRDLPMVGLQALQVGQHTVQRPPPPAEPRGMDATLWGDGTFIDYRIRTIMPEGDDTLRMIYELGYFEDRLRVHGANGITASAGDQLQVGNHELSGGIRTVAPSGIQALRGQVPVPAMRKQNRVNVPDNGAFDVWGDTWALPVTAGQIQPRGDDHMLSGYAALARTIAPAGMTGQFGQPHALHFLGAAGFDASQFGVPVLIGFGCGARARLIEGWDALRAGTPSVQGA